jgi:hypothetical protein
MFFIRRFRKPTPCPLPALMFFVTGGAFCALARGRPLRTDKSVLIGLMGKITNQTASAKFL